MSKTVDERVVEMKFNNGQFEKNVRTTLSTLDKLKAKLNLSGASKGLDNLQATANKMSFANIESSVGALEKRFSTMGIVGMTVIQNLTNGLMSFAGKLTSFVTGGIMQGGLTRAMNLQNARFQLQGLMKDASKVEAVMKDVNYGVQDTAYSLDAAANVAAQLAASGMQAGEGMRYALRGISGVAAMTNSSYEDIGRIYTQIAGNGRLMGDQLLQLSSRGMNAAAILGQQLGKTEAQIREMVSKGKIDFATFAKAMDDAFGEHAKEANRTFNGALSNIRAALAKIGAEFYEPLIAMDGPLVKLLNVIREKINEIKNDVLPFIQELSKTTGNVITNIAKKIEENKQNSYNPFFDGYEDADKKVKKFNRALELMQQVAERTGMTVKEVNDHIEVLNSRFLLFNSFKNIGTALMTIFKNIGKAFNEVFGGKSQDALFNTMAAFNKLTTILRNSVAANADKIYNTFKGLFSILSFGINIIKGILSVVSRLVGPLFGVTGGILSLTSAFGKWISELRDGIKQTNVFNVIVQKLGEFITNFMNGIKDFLHGFIGTFGKVVSSVAKAAANAISTIFHALGESISSGSALKFMDLLNKGIFGLVLWKIKNFVNYIGKGGTLFDTLKRFVNSVKGIADSISGILNTVKNTLKAWQQELQAKTLFKIAAAIGILALALVTLSDIPKDKLTDALSAITTLFINLVVALKVLAAGPLQSAGKKMILAIGLAMSVLILASALKKIASLETDELIRGVIAISIFVKIMSDAMKKLSADQKYAIKGATGIIALAIAIRILASACKVFANMDWQEMAKGLVGVGVLLAEIWAFTKFAKTDGKLIKMGISVVILAEGLKILAGVCKTFAELSWENIGKGLTAIGGLLAEIAAFSALTRFFKKTISAGIALNIFVLAIRGLVEPLMTLSSMSWDEIGRGLTALGGSLAILTAAIGVLTWIAEKGGFWGGINMNFAALSIEMLTKLLSKIVEAFKGFASISWDGIIKSLVSIGASITILVVATKKLQTKDIASIMAAAIALNIMAKSIAILGSLGIVGVATGVLGLAGVFTVLGVAMHFLIPMAGGMIKVAGSIATVAASLALLGLSMGVMGAGLGVFMTSLIGAFLGFKAIGWDTIIKGLIGIAGAFIIIGVAAHVLAPMTMQIIALAGSVALFGLSVAAVGVGVSLIVQALSTMAAVGKEGAESAGAALKALIASMLELIPIAIKQLGIALLELLSVVKEMIPMLGDILIEAVRTLVNVLVTCAPEIVNGLFELIVQALTMLNKYVPTIANLLFDFIINVINTLSIRLPELVTAIINFLAKLFDAVVQVFSEFGAGELLKAVISLGVLTIVLQLMAALVHIVPQAMLGILAFGLLVTELAAVIAAVGKLSQIPGFKELVTDGGNFLQLIGTAIGQFVGGIVGGIAKGVSAVLPEVAKNLSEFMTNLGPFIEGMKNVELSMLPKVGILIASILYLSEAGFIAGIMQLLAFCTGNNLPKMGTQLSEFMTNLQPFLETAANIDPKILGSIAVLTACIMSLTAANLLNNITGFMGVLSGGNSLATFGLQIALLGLGMRKFVDNLGTFGDEQITAVRFACEALTTLSEAGSKIPNTGGIAALFAGDNDIALFAAKLPLVGLCLNLFTKTLGTFSDEQIKTVSCAADAIRVLSSAGSDIPNTGGIAALFAGDNDIALFAAKLPLLGMCLRGFVMALGKFGDEQISAIGAAGDAIRTLSEAASGIPNSGGIVDLFTGSNDIALFGAKLPFVGACLRGFVFSLGKFGDDQIKTAECAARCIATMAEAAGGIPKTGGMVDLFTGTNDIAIFGAKLPFVGACLNGFVHSLGTFGDDQIKTAECAAKCIATMSEAAANVPKTGGLGTLFTGTNDISLFAFKLPSVGVHLAGFIKSLYGFSEDQVKVAGHAAEALSIMGSIEVPKTGGLGILFSGTNDISLFAYKLPSVGANLAGFVKELGEFSGDQVKVAGYAGEAIKALATAAGDISTTGGLKTLFEGDNDISIFAWKLPGVGAHLAGFIKEIGGFSEEEVKVAKYAAEALAAIASVEVPTTGGLKSLFEGDNDISKFSDKFPGLATNLKEFMINLGEFKEDKIVTVNSAVEAIKAIASLSGTDIKSTGENLEEFGARMTSFAWKLKEFLEAMSQSDGDAITASIEKIKELVNAIKEITTDTVSNLENFTNELGRVGKDGIQAFVNAIKDEQLKVDAINAINNIIQAVLDKADSRKGDVENKADNLVKAAIDIVKKPMVANEAGEAGKFFVQGFANGIKNNLYLARDAGSEVGKKALEAAKRSIDSNSPSKETYKLGTFFDQGFVNGVRSLEGKIYKETYGVGDTAKDGLSKAIKNVSDLIMNGIDDDITIRPVLDLSNVQSGAAAINGMFNNPSIGVMSNLNAISSGMRSSRQNGGEEVISAIERLGKNLGNVSGDTYNINGVTYDNGSEVQEAVSTLVRAARIERRR